MHRVFDLFFGGACRKIDQDIEREELKEIAVFPIGRAGADVVVFPIRAFPLNSRRGRVLGDFVGCGRHIENDPMVIHAVGTEGFGHVGIVHEEDEAFGVGRYIRELKRGIDVFPFARIEGRDNAVIFKSGTGKLHNFKIIEFEKYTQMISKFGNMTRRRPEFESGVAGAEAAKLKKFSDAGGSQIQWLSDAVRNQILKLFGYKWNLAV
jgi:hypothetical protein